MSAIHTAALSADKPAGTTESGLGLRRIAKGERLTGTKAEDFAADVEKAYETLSIRRICEETGRSYGAIQHLLSSRGVTMRPRGYQHPAPATPAAAS